MQNPGATTDSISFVSFIVGVMRSSPDIHFLPLQKRAGKRIPSSICHIHLQAAIEPLSAGSLMRIINEFGT